VLESYYRIEWPNDETTDLQTTDETADKLLTADSYLRDDEYGNQMRPNAIWLLVYGTPKWEL
jgi:hypothetical protein